jgi:hypothetical protein
MKIMGIIYLVLQSLFLIFGLILEISGKTKEPGTIGFLIFVVVVILLSFWGIFALVKNLRKNNPSASAHRLGQYVDEATATSTNIAAADEDALAQSSIQVRNTLDSTIETSNVLDNVKTKLEMDKMKRLLKDKKNIINELYTEIHDSSNPDICKNIEAIASKYAISINNIGEYLVEIFSEFLIKIGCLQFRDESRAKIAAINKAITTYNIKSEDVAIQLKIIVTPYSMIDSYYNTRDFFKTEFEAIEANVRHGKET